MKNHTSFLAILLLFITIISIDASTEAIKPTQIFSTEELASIRSEKQKMFLDAYNNALTNGSNAQVAHDIANKVAYNYQQSFCRNLPEYCSGTLDTTNQIKNKIDALDLEKNQLTACKAPASTKKSIKKRTRTIKVQQQDSELSENQTSPKLYNYCTHCFYNDTKKYEDDLYRYDLYLTEDIKTHIQSHKDLELEIPDFDSYQDIDITTLLTLIPELRK